LFPDVFQQRCPFGESDEMELEEDATIKPPRELIIPLEASKITGTCEGNLRIFP
jgi:hypothetical protein